MLRNKGYSLSAWVVTFSVIVAAVFMIRVPLNRALQAKVTGVTDYMLWKKSGQTPDQHKGDDNSFVKTKSDQSMNTAQLERKGYIKNNADSETNENSVSSNVEEGSQAVLKTVNLNDILP